MKKRNYVLILFACMLIVSLQAQSPRTGTDYALFFVVQDFDNWTDFPASSTQQVRDIEQELKARYGFQTEFLLNPTRRQVLDKLTQYHGRHFGKDDQLLLFFSMHGHYDEGGTGALIPKDGLLSDPVYDTWITHPLLADLVNRIPCNHILLSLDACYSGTFGGSRGRPDRKVWETTPDCADKCKQALLYKSRLYMTSGGVERTPTDSQFADKWLEALRVKNTDGVLSFHKLFGVLGEAYPVPMFGEFRDHKKGGDFVFVDRSACGPAMTDATHWQQTKRSPEREALLEHLRLFPGCEHEGEVIGLLTPGVVLSTNEPDNKPKEANPPANLSVKKPADLPNFVFVEGGPFQMGERSVTVSDFYISIHELTFEEYDAYCIATGKAKPSDEGWGRGNHPVINVDWYDAIEYCNWRSRQDGLKEVYSIDKKRKDPNISSEHNDKKWIVTANWDANGYRLPTEAEWEYAARSRGGKNEWAGTSTESSLSTYGNFCDTKCTFIHKTKSQNDGYQYTASVGSLRANDLGLYDMSGNVWEWCWDWHGTYPTISQNNPSGPDSGSDRVLRGGSWSLDPADLRCAHRYLSTPIFSSIDIGFRLARAAR